MKKEIYFLHFNQFLWVDDILVMKRVNISQNVKIAKDIRYEITITGLLGDVILPPLKLHCNALFDKRVEEIKLYV